MQTLKPSRTKKNASDPNDRLSYSEWMYENGGTGDDKDAAYYEGLAAAGMKFAKNLPNYGAAAESLSNQGLLESGYRDYTARAAAKERKADEAEVTDAYYGRRRESYAKYEDYVTDYMEKQQALFREIFNDLRQKGLTDPDEAYAYAVSLGLNAEGAGKVAQSGSASARAKLRSEAANYIYKNKLDHDEAKEYALSVGLSEPDAERLAKYAKESSYNRVLGESFVSALSPNEYVEYLRALERKNLLNP